VSSVRGYGGRDHSSCGLRLNVIRDLLSEKWMRVIVVKWVHVTVSAKPICCNGQNAYIISLSIGLDALDGSGRNGIKLRAIWDNPSPQRGFRTQRGLKSHKR
jgi:hypothetical protein